MAVNPGPTRKTKFADINECVDPIAMDKFLATLQCCKNRTSLCTDGLNFELMKYVPVLLSDRLLNFTNLCWTTGHIPEDCQMTKVVPIFKKGDHNDCDNYRGVRLLKTSYKAGT